MAYAPVIWVVCDPVHHIGITNACLGVARRINDGINHPYLINVNHFSKTKINEHKEENGGTPDIIISGGYAPSKDISWLASTKNHEDIGLKKTTFAQIYRPHEGYPDELKALDFIADYGGFDRSIIPENRAYDMIFVPHRVGKSFMDEISVTLKQFKIPNLEDGKKVLSVCVGDLYNHGAEKGQLDSNIAHKIVKLARDEGYFAIVNFSKRTPEKSEKTIRGIIEMGLKNDCFFNYGNQRDFKNKYPNLFNKVPNLIYYSMEIADRIVVTNDSISMMSEAGTFKKPIEIFSSERPTSQSIRATTELIKRGNGRILGEDTAFAEKIERVQNPAKEIAHMIFEIHKERFEKLGLPLGDDEPSQGAWRG